MTVVFSAFCCVLHSEPPALSSVSPAPPSTAARHGFLPSSSPVCRFLNLPLLRGIAYHGPARPRVERSSPLRTFTHSAWFAWALNTLKKPWRTRKIAVIALCCPKSFYDAVLKLQRPSAPSLAFLTQMGDTVTTTRYRGTPGAPPHLFRVDHPNPSFPEEDIFAGNLMLADEPAGSGDEDDAALLGVSEDEEAIPPSGVPQASGHAALPQSILLEVPNKMDRFSASVHQAAYKSLALAVRTLNVSFLLSAYQAEILDELGQQLEKGTPSLPLWKEILTVNDLVLRNARQAVQACGRSMALSVVGERALWLNLSGLPDSEKRRIAGASVEPGRALFGPAVTLMQQRCDDKKEDEAFKLCLPRKAAPRQAPPARLPNTPAMGRHFHQGKERPRNKPPPRQNNPPPAKHWGTSTPAAAGRPSNPTPSDSKRKRPA